MHTETWVIFVISVLTLLGCQESSTPSSQFTAETTASEEPAITTSEEKIIDLLRQDEEFIELSADDFEALGWDLPDEGKQVKELADGVPGGAFDPTDLEELSITDLGYQAKWHELRFNKYGLDWDITGLYLQPQNPVPNLPTLVQIHGGGGNFYQFFLTPLNEPGFGQYLAQKIPVLLVTIPGNYQHGGWKKSRSERKPRYLLDKELSDKEIQARNAIFTFELISEGIVQLIDSATNGPLVVTGHSTGGEFQFLLKDRLRDRMQGLSFGWGSGGPARLRREWTESVASERSQTEQIRYRPIYELRTGGLSKPGDRSGGGTDGYIGPFNPFLEYQSTNIYDWYFRVISDPDLIRNTANALSKSQFGRKASFKQEIQYVEHRGNIDHRQQMEADIRQITADFLLPINVDEVISDLFSTVRTDMSGYRKMVWTTSTLDSDHWDPDPSKARELFVANQYREENPQAKIRMLVYDTLMTHIGYTEKPRQLAGGAFATIQWLFSENDGD